MQDFTPEIQAKIPEYIKYALEGVLDGERYKNFDFNKAQAAVFNIYDVCGHARPKIMVVENPLEQQLLFNFMCSVSKRGKVDATSIYVDMKNYSSSNLFALSVYSDYYFTWFKFLHEEFSIPLEPEVKELFYKCSEMQRESGIYSCVFSEEVAIVCKYPIKVHRNESDFTLHNINGNAVEWGYSFAPFNCYYVNGRNVINEIYDNADTMTFEEFLTLNNEEDKAAIITLKKERHGNEEVLKFLGAEIIDEQTIVHPNSVETQKLYKTKKSFSWANDSKGNTNVPLAWNEMVCPSTGQTYLIETCPSFDSVVESAKWLRDSRVPTDVPYEWQSAN